MQLAVGMLPSDISVREKLKESPGTDQEMGPCLHQAATSVPPDSRERNGDEDGNAQSRKGKLSVGTAIVIRSGNRNLEYCE